MKDPAFPLYAQDFLIGVMHLDFAARGQYITLLAYQWDKKEIPKHRLPLLVGKEWSELSPDLREKFTDLGDTIQNQRLEKEREKRQRFKQAQSEKGKKGGRPKKSQTKAHLKPTKNPKKPLEKESENEKENKSRLREKSNKIWPQLAAKYPASQEEELQELWHSYVMMRWKAHRFSYKTTLSERLALENLLKLARGQPAAALEMLRETIARQWKGFFAPDQAPANGLQQIRNATHGQKSKYLH